jgi:hypothetical protein
MNGILPDSTPFSSGKERYLSRMTGRFPGLPFGPTLRACSLRHPAYAVRCAAYWLRCSNPFVASPQIPSVVNPSIPFVVSPSIPFVVNPSIPFVVNPSIPFVVSLSNHERNHGGAYSSSNRPKNRGCGQLYPLTLTRRARAESGPSGSCAASDHRRHGSSYAQADGTAPTFPAWSRENPPLQKCRACLHP